jgi:murein DD-endopeptidase MepM/ murein hydrolase activator NlpD
MSPIDQKIEQIEIEQEILEEKLSRLNFPDGSSIESDPELGSFIQSQTPPDPALPTRNVDPKQAKLNQLEKRMLKVSKTIQVWEWAQSFIPSGWPVSGRISSPFGFRMHPMYGEPHFHRGIDIASDPGTPIQVTAEGTVAYSGWGGSYGYVILVAHAFGFSTLYGHTEQLFVEVGQRVSKGQLIALVGSTGAATGAHLHYEVRRWNQPILPNPFLGV